MEYSTAVKSMCCGDELPAERNILIVSGWEGVNNESTVCMIGEGGEKCGVVEWVKRNTLRWFGHVERMKQNELVKKCM